MSGEWMSLDYLRVIPPDGPWVLILGPDGETDHVGPFHDSDELVRWYELHGEGLPLVVISLVSPDDYPGVQQTGPIPLPDPQAELPFNADYSELPDGPATDRPGGDAGVIPYVQDPHRPRVGRSQWRGPSHPAS